MITKRSLFCCEHVADAVLYARFGAGVGDLLEAERRHVVVRGLFGVADVKLDVVPVDVRQRIAARLCGRTHAAVLAKRSPPALLQARPGMDARSGGEKPRHEHIYGAAPGRARGVLRADRLRGALPAGEACARGRRRRVRAGTRGRRTPGCSAASSSRASRLSAEHRPPRPVAVQRHRGCGSDPRPWFGYGAARLRASRRSREARSPRRGAGSPAAAPALAARHVRCGDRPVPRCARAQRLAGLPVYVEIPRDERWARTAARRDRRPRASASRCEDPLRRDRRRKRSRASTNVATFIAAAAAEHGVPSRRRRGCTTPCAGRRSAGDARMHGFLNLLAACALARRGDARDVRDRAC